MDTNEITQPRDIGRENVASINVRRGYHGALVELHDGRVFEVSTNLCQRLLDADYFTKTYKAENKANGHIYTPRYDLDALAEQYAEQDSIMDDNRAMTGVG